METTINKVKVTENNNNQIAQKFKASIHKYEEERFPKSLSLRCAGGPVFSTTLVENFGGFEQRNINWHYARMRYNIAPSIQSEDDVKTIVNFFRAHKGRAIGFRFKDWMDYSATNMLIKVADGMERDFYLCKRYAVNDVEDIRRINKPVIDTVKVYCDGQLQHPEINYSNGKFTFESPPSKGAKITADFEFDVPVRFDTDEIISNNDLQYINTIDIPLIEIKNNT